MKKATTVLFCLLSASPLALAQLKPVEVQKAPPSQFELDAQKKAVHMQMTACHAQAEKRKLKQGSKEFAAFMTQCIKPKP